MPRQRFKIACAYSKLVPVTKYFSHYLCFIFLIYPTQIQCHQIGGQTEATTATSHNMSVVIWSASRAHCYLGTSHMHIVIWSLVTCTLLFGYWSRAHCHLGRVTHLSCLKKHMLVKFIFPICQFVKHFE